ncbi:MAG: hypothetical protein KGI08_09885, partial [Thaumarchaeota archaeon]|nr:hypothetical protein [Nitrososphaerota archaeon]
MSSEIVFTEPIDVSGVPPSNVEAQTGTQFRDITNTFRTAGAQAPSPSFWDSVAQAIGYHTNPVGESVSSAGSQVGDFFSNLFRFGNVSNPVDTSIQTPRVSTSFNPNIAIGGAAVVGTTALVYSTLTNPGVQQTAQSYAGA